MSETVSTNHVIDPIGFYSEQSVLLLLGVGYETQRRERDSGRLASVKRGGVAVYKGSALIEWLQLDANRENQAQKAAPAARRITRPTPRSSRPDADALAIEEWNARLSHKRKSMSAQAAVRAVVKEAPELHRRYLAAMNAVAGRAGPAARLSHRPTQPTPPAARPTRTFRQQWDEAVAEKLRQGLTPAKARAAVVKENPALHRGMLAEMNRDRPRVLARLAV